MLTQEEITELFENTFGECKTYFEISDKLHCMEECKDIDVLRKYFCNEVLYCSYRIITEVRVCTELLWKSY